MIDIYELTRDLNFLLPNQFIILVPVLLFVAIIIKSIVKMKFNIVHAAALLIIYPAITPATAYYQGYDYFTLLNYNLQDDIILIKSAIVLSCIFLTSFFIGSMMPNSMRYKKKTTTFHPNSITVYIIFSINLLLIFLFLESSTILYSTYGDIKQDSTEFGSTVNQLFNLTVAIFICSYIGGLEKNRNIIILLFFIGLLLIMSRRTTAIGLICILLFFMQRTNISFTQIMFAIIGVFLMYLVGEVRTVGIVNFINGVRELANLQSFYSAPGGASNIFVGTMGVIDLTRSSHDELLYNFPIAGWFFGVYESKLYEEALYSYNGGMHLVNVIYWNFGIIGVFVGGMTLGWIMRRTQNIMSNIVTFTGSLPVMLSAGTTIMMPILLWYHPIGLIKLVIAIVLVHLVLKVFKFSRVRMKQSFLPSQI